MIGVKNLNKEAVEGRYDGKDYTFPPGVTVAVSEEVARHILGFGVEDKTRQLARLGWLTTSADLKSAVARLENFQYLAAEQTFKEADPQTMPTSVKDKTLHLPNKQQPIASK